MLARLCEGWSEVNRCGFGGLVGVRGQIGARAVASALDKSRLRLLLATDEQNRADLGARLNLVLKTLDRS